MICILPLSGEVIPDQKMRQLPLSGEEQAMFTGSWPRGGQIFDNKSKRQEARHV